VTTVMLVRSPSARARRRQDGQRAEAVAERLDREVETFKRWEEEQRKAGRPEVELTWGNCVRELGLLRMN